VRDVVNCGVCELAVAPKLFALTICKCSYSIHNTFYSHLDLTTPDTTSFKSEIKGLDTDFRIMECLIYSLRNLTKVQELKTNIIIQNTNNYIAQ
jgi:hypothetical protein